MVTRRSFLAAAGAASVALPAMAAQRKFTLAFTPGSIGIQADQRKAIDMAAQFGYESVQPMSQDLGKLAPAQLEELKVELKQKNLQWAAAGMPVDFRKDEMTFRQGMAQLPAHAKIYEKAGVTRFGTWLMPRHDELTYLSYFKVVARRLREIATICEDHGQRFGLEYVGTPSLLVAGRYPFVHTMAETKELIAAAGKTNLGFVLDSWHWWTAGDSRDDILTLTNHDVVSCDLNDAPKGLEMIEQQDGSRELPVATGVIPVQEFLSALVAIGYDGPVRPEPFNKPLNEMDDEPAAEAAAESMKKAFGLVA